MMIRKLFPAFVLFFFAAVSQAADTKLKPFVLAEVTTGDVATVQKQIERKLSENGFEIAGSYSPYKEAVVIAITNDALKQNAAKSEFGGYGAAMRVAITKINNDVQISFTNPTYLANAYRMAGDLTAVTNKLRKVLGQKEDFGSVKGLSVSKLRKYHYMFGMEYFDDTNMHLLNMFPSHEKAVKTVEQNLAKGLAGVHQVYRIKIPGKNEVVFGVSMKMPSSGGDKYMDDEYIMSVIDFKEPRSTAHLPYEILVSDDKVYHLYARFRIAIDFPDLSMMGENSFMNIIQTPEAIKKALTKVAGGKVNDDYWQQ
jgi:hypothetical protein